MTKPIYEVREATDILSAAILRTDLDGRVWVIPIDPANSDYQVYLASLEAPTVQHTLC